MATEARKSARAITKTPIQLPDEGEWGPAMKALSTDRQRAFVYAFVVQGGRNYLAAYLEAGYSNTVNGATVNAWKLAHDERIQAAIREESYKRMGRAGMAAADLVARIVENEDAKLNIRLKAAAMIMNRVGLHEHTEHKVTVEKQLNPQEKIERAIALAKQLGMDPKALLGARGIALPKTSDASEPIEDAVIVETLDDWTAL